MKSIYDPLLGKPVRVTLTSTNYLGYLKEINGFDSIVLNPSLVNYSTVLKERGKLEEKDTIIPYISIQGIQEVTDMYLVEIVNALEEKNRRDAKDLNKPKRTRNYGKKR